MTTHKTNTVITIDLKEYARLQEIEKAARKVVETEGEEHHVHDKALRELRALLEGAE